MPLGYFIYFVGLLIITDIQKRILKKKNEQKNALAVIWRHTNGPKLYGSCIRCSSLTIGEGRSSRLARCR